LTSSAVGIIVINVTRKSYEITADMNLEQASRMYLESIKRRAEDEDDE
jgi:hypothetical protein